MATILVTGKTELFTQKALERISKNYKVIMTGQKKLFHTDRDIRFFQVTPVEEKFSQLFDVYSFDAVWYVSGYADGGEGTFGESKMLEQTFLECSRSRVEKLILLSCVDSQNFVEQYGRNGAVIRKEYPLGRAFGAAQLEELAEYLGEKTRTKTVILRLPYVADRINEENFLGSIFEKMVQEEKVFFPYHAHDRVDFVSMRDLDSLLVSVTEETEDESGSYFVTSGYQYRYSDLEELLKLANPKLQIIYENYPDTARVPDYPLELRKRYGFVPVDNVMENIGSCYRTYLNERKKGGHGIWGRVKHLLKAAGKGIFKYIELLLVFVLAEFLSRYTSNSVYFKFVDVRLFFIVIMGTMYGMRMGVLAALLECVVLIREYMQIGINGMLLFYNIENWIPFVIYIITGSVTGYVKNKKTEDLDFAHKEYSLLRNKYIFLNEVYHGAIENKGEYKRQILGFKDSFGKIFDAVQKLDTLLPESIFLEGLRIMEDILENRSIAIYTLDSWQRFGRLAVCSNSLLSRLTKSIKLEDYPQLLEQVKNGGVWKNAELKKDTPMYACGVFRDGNISLLITIWEVETTQYGMRYMNVFKILCGLVQTSFLRALDYQALGEEKMYYPGTNVLYPDRLRQLAGVQQDMKDAGVADYVLIRFADRDMHRISESLSGMIRATDILGADENGFLYLLLVQMNRQNFGIVGGRLASKGIAYELVEKVG